MTSNSPAKVAETWIEKWSTEVPSTIGEVVLESELDCDLPVRNPELCLLAIVEILSRIPADPSEQLFQALAAGPLEELLVANGEHVIKEVVSLCRKNPEFRRLLNGVWLRSAKPDISARLEKYRSNPW